MIRDVRWTSGSSPKRFCQCGRSRASVAKAVLISCPVPALKIWMPDAGNLHVRFDERDVETEPRLNQ
jgi:hypothetical protein